MPKVVITRPIPGSSIERLKQAGYDLQINPSDRVLSKDELKNFVAGADAILALLTDHIDTDILDAAGNNLKIIANYAVGFDNIDLEAAKQRNVIVTNTPSDKVSECVAEFTWAVILALSRRVVEGDEFGRKGAYRGWEPDIFLGRDVYGKTLGIIGLGRVGSMVARRAKGFNMEVIYTKKEPDPKAEQELGIQYQNLPTLLAQSDYVTLHVPLTYNTHHLINEGALSQMKPFAYLINTARGGVVDEHALVAALKSGQIAGAALDVHENEPNMNPELLLMENVILTPHIASATHEVREEMTKIAVDNILAVLSGQQPLNPAK